MPPHDEGYLSGRRVRSGARVALNTHVTDSRAIERYLGMHSSRQVGASGALHPIDERAGY